MSKPFDAAGKAILDRHIRDWLRLLGATFDEVQPFTVDISSVGLNPDRLWLATQGTQKQIYHIELQVNMNTRWTYAPASSTNCYSYALASP